MCLLDLIRKLMMQTMSLFGRSPPHLASPPLADRSGMFALNASHAKLELGRTQHHIRYTTLKKLSGLK